MFRKRENKKNIYSIRKYSVGAVSVTVAALIFVSGGATAHANLSSSSDSSATATTQEKADGEKTKEEKVKDENLIDNNATGTLGTVTWKVLKNGTLEFSPTSGTTGSFDSGNKTWATSDSDMSTATNYGKEIRKYKEQIKSVVFKPGVKANGSLNYMFYEYNKLEKIDFSGFDTSNATGFKGMLQGTALTEVDLSKLNTSNVGDMSYMFHKATKLTKINFGPNFNTLKVTDFANMFDGASSLKTLDLTSFDTSKIQNTLAVDGNEDIFKDTTSLTTVAVPSNFNMKMEGFKTVTFKDGDQVLKTLKVKEGKQIDPSFIPTDPEKEGNKFEGWSESDITTKNITNDTVVSAKWKAEEKSELEIAKEKAKKELDELVKKAIEEGIKNIQNSDDESDVKTKKIEEFKKLKEEAKKNYEDLIMGSATKEELEENLKKAKDGFTNLPVPPRPPKKDEKPELPQPPKEKEEEGKKPENKGEDKKPEKPEQSKPDNKDEGKKPSEPKQPQPPVEKPEAPKPPKAEDKEKDKKPDMPVPPKPEEKDKGEKTPEAPKPENKGEDKKPEKPEQSKPDNKDEGKKPSEPKTPQPPVEKPEMPQPPKTEEKGKEENKPNTPQAPKEKEGGEGKKPEAPKPEEKDKGEKTPEKPKPENKGEDKKPEKPEQSKPDNKDEGKKPSEPKQPQPPVEKPETPQPPKAEDKEKDKKPDMPVPPKTEEKGKEENKPNTPQAPKEKEGEEGKKPEAPKPEGKDKGEKIPEQQKPGNKGEDKKPEAPKPPKADDKDQMPPKDNMHKEFKIENSAGIVTVVYGEKVDADGLKVRKVEDKSLIEKIKKQLNADTVRVLDLKMTKGGKEVSVNKMRTVRIALAKGETNVEVYHVKEDGTLEKIPSRVVNGEVVFEVSHFSKFAIVSKKANQMNNKVQTGATNINANGQKVLSNTGLKSIYTATVGVVGLAFGLLISLMRRRTK
ncbi:BspA family leucine-rich repeat surface protein [Gemella cuniculi]|uniref:BspA family leucine-rich repeat surface protein n=1 Tax=Gemella cuniculi TaxID=150240 RepID=UPI0003FD0904|nr:BspA family leucine-rich repeat surface protein [Gemella cuniculi]